MEALEFRLKHLKVENRDFEAEQAESLLNTAHWRDTRKKLSLTLGLTILLSTLMIMIFMVYLIHYNVRVRRIREEFRRFANDNYTENQRQDLQQLMAAIQRRRNRFH
ncbi:hypothetical protein GCK72_017199 [Caenorhabditis remanei]|uniref:Uncharacterized protein n=1 Tax=Caenorhabditis remanei TaxID=31234 RepID=A0A6A5G6G6_CAERE|nr:hypothetical protein GCK72_017199 [Caenorhabditis remanei]KAF1750648.1 hypothetical protein GCK72_017199 [Caenorhabditis remanei]